MFFFKVCTHGHPDHVGNNNLFTAAVQHIVGFSGRKIILLICI